MSSYRKLSWGPKGLRVLTPSQEARGPLANQSSTPASLVQFTGKYLSKFSTWQPNSEISKTQYNGSRHSEGEKAHYAESPGENTDILQLLNMHFPTPQ